MSTSTAIHDPASAAWNFARQGDIPAAIATAVRCARETQDTTLLAELVKWRREAFTHVSHPPGPASWPPELPDPFPGHNGIPAIAAADLTAEILGGAILHHGSLRVNGLVSPARAETLRQGTDRAMAARDDAHAGRPASDPGWYVPLDAPTLENSRNWVESSGAVWTADCPPMLFEVIEAFRDAGVIDHIADLMGERPVLSVGKSTLRRVPVTTGTDWHQDGAFLGRDVRSVNVWLALSPCGVDAAGLDVVGRRLPYIVQTGSHGAHFEWAVGPGLVDMLASGGAPVEAPAFAAGDALLFDHMMLHRTGIRPGMTRERWAIESWFFAPSNYPAEHVPLLV